MVMILSAEDSAVDGMYEATLPTTQKKANNMSKLNLCVARPRLKVSRPLGVAVRREFYVRLANEGPEVVRAHFRG